MRLSVGAVLDVSPPEFVADDKVALKEWLWEHYKQEIFANMTLEVKNDSREAKQLQEEDDAARSSKRQRRSYDQQNKLSLLDKISQVQRQFFQSEGPKVVFGGLLEGLLELMDSEYGFIGEAKYEPDGTMYLQLHAITNIAWDAASRAFYEDNNDSGLKFTNLKSLFGTVMTSKQVVIANTPKNDPRACGVPHGHPPINHFLGIPFFKKGGELVGMVGIANKPGGYSDLDVDYLEPLTVTCSNLIQALQHCEQNRHLISTLETKVAERTLELKLANEHLEDVNRKLVRASAAQLENFASMSHEIRTPLNCILGLSSLLQDSGLNSMQEESLRMIVTSGDLLLAVVNDVMDFSKLESGNVDIVMLRSNLQETLDAVVHSIEFKGQSKGLVLRTSCDTLLPEFVRTDSRRLQQILYNLLGNAIKFSKERVTVELQISVCRADKCPALTLDETSKETDSSSAAVHEIPQNSVIENGDVSTKCPFGRSSTDPPPLSAVAATSINTLGNAYGSTCPVPNSEARVLRFTVKDYGIGIKKRDRDRIFQPFHQASADTERLYGGTGLGLTIASKLVNAMGGIIYADSEEGKWAKFTVEFPFVDACADVHGISKKLKNVTVFHVHTVPEDVAHFNAICDGFHVKTVNFQSMDEIDALVKKSGSLDHERSYVCLVHEDLYRPVSYQGLSTAVKKSVLLTFGSTFSVNEADGHYRSYLQMIPSVLMQSMISYLRSPGSTTGRARTDTETSYAPVSYAGLKVLVAEDNIINQKVLVRMLHRFGITFIDIAENGQEAVDKEASEQYDVVFMDMQMPVMDGLEACRMIVNDERRKGRTTPRVVFVTAHVDNSFVLQASRAGGNGYLPKPFNLKGIEKCLQTLQLGSRLDENDSLS